MLTLENLYLLQDDFHLRANLKIIRGQKTAIIGPSGGGKSTLLSAIAGFLTPAAGRILADGQDITHMPPGLRPVSLLFQDNNLFPHLTVTQNIALGLHPGLKLSDQDRRTLDTALAQVDLQDLGDKKPSQLSGGQQQRAALARALLRNRPILLLDEPFAALGPALKTQMLDLVDRIVKNTGITLLMVTHDPKDALHIADQTVLVANGIAAPPVKTSTLFRNPPKALSDYLGSGA